MRRASIERPESCARCGLVAVGYARGGDGQRYCHDDDRSCYSQMLWDLILQLPREERGGMAAMIVECGEEHCCDGMCPFPNPVRVPTGWDDFLPRAVVVENADDVEALAREN